MGNLPHKNIKINNFGNVEREEKYDFWHFYKDNINKDVLINKLKERKQNKSKAEPPSGCC